MKCDRESQRTDQLTRELRDLFAKAKLPTNPSLASQILVLCSDPTSTAESLGKVIRADPALAARVLAAANSIHYAQREPATTIERAITVLGLNHLRNAALGFQLVAHVDRLGGAPFDMKAFWRQSLARACFCQATARVLVPELEHQAFLVGLLQEIGVLLLVQLFGACYAQLYGENLSPTAFASVEQGAFPHTHTQAVGVMCAEWNLPEQLRRPVEDHHKPPLLSNPPAQDELLCAASYIAGGVRLDAQVEVDPAEDAVRQLAGELGLRPTELGTIQQNAAEIFRSTGAVFATVLPEEADVSDLLNEAVRQLTSAALAAGRRVVDIEQSRAKVLRERRQLRRALRDYRERAALDPLTHVLNRGALSDSLCQAFQEGREMGTSIGLLFIDVDNFKSLNDKYGHLAGDAVLKALVAGIQEQKWPASITGRYGGEEFVVVLRDTTQRTCQDAGEQLVQVMHRLRVAELGPDERLTCSIGAAWLGDLQQEVPEQLLAFADQLMYRAKRSGKDRCCFATMVPSSRCQGSYNSLEASGTAGVTRTMAHEHASIAVDSLVELAQQLNAKSHGNDAGVRGRVRNKFVAHCACRYFPGNGLAMSKCPAATRNVSTCGVGLLVPMPFTRGQPLEIHLPRGREPLYLAGLVAFCRHVRGGVYEIGVQLITYAPEAILSSDPATAVAKLEWVARALTPESERSGQTAIV